MTNDAYGDDGTLRMNNFKKATIDELANYLMEMHPPFKTVDGVLHRCDMDDSYCYVNDAEAYVRRELEEMNPDITNHDKNEVVTKIKDRTLAEKEEFDNYPDWIHVKNGWVNIRTKQFKHNDFNMLSFGALPVTYDPKAIAFAFLRYLRTTLEPDHIRIVVKMLGYTLIKSTKFQKAFMLVGEGNNGKSVLLDTIKAFYGSQRCSSETLQRLSSRPFSPALLDGKMVNLCADIPSEKVAYTGFFKMLVSGDMMTVEHKNRDPFQMVNYAKLIFSANDIPKSDDMSYAYLRRWVIIPFLRTFEGGSDDKNLRAKLMTEKELSGILNLALTGLQILEDDDGFNEIDIEQTRRQYALGASRIKDFINFCIKINPNMPVNESPLTEEVHVTFAEFCREKGVKFADVGKLGSELLSLGVENRQRNSKSDRRRRYKGVQLTEEGKRLLSQAMLRCSSKSSILMQENSILSDRMGQTPEHQSTLSQTKLVEVLPCGKCSFATDNAEELRQHKSQSHEEAVA